MEGEDAVRGPQALRQGCARRPQAVPAGDERGCANLEQPGPGHAGETPAFGSVDMETDSTRHTSADQRRTHSTMSDLRRIN